MLQVGNTWCTPHLIPRRGQRDLGPLATPLFQMKKPPRRPMGTSGLVGQFGPCGDVRRRGGRADQDLILHTAAPALSL